VIRTVFEETMFVKRVDVDIKARRLKEANICESINPSFLSSPVSKE
jgi:hypothetical protein